MLTFIVGFILGAACAIVIPGMILIMKEDRKEKRK